MPLINEFQRSSDFGTLKNDSQSNVISVTIAAGTVFSPTNPILAEAIVSAGTVNAGLRARGSSTKYAREVSATTIYSDSSFNIPSQPSVPAFVQALYCTLDKISPTQVRLRVGTDGVNGTPPNFRVNETQTITFVFSTFLSPFD